MPGFLHTKHYSGSRLLPEALYAVSWEVRLHQATKQDGSTYDNSKPRLGVMGHFVPIDEDGAAQGDPHDQFFSMGGKADQSWAPDPDTGKGVVALEGGLGQSLPTSSNWAIMFNSLVACGFPQDDMEDDNNIGVMDGIWIRTKNIPEPEERKAFAKQAATGEGEQDQRRGSGLIPACVDIVAKPWDGEGGMPEEGVAKKAAPKKGAPAKPAAKAPAKAAPAAAKKPTAKAVEVDVRAELSDVLAEILGENEAGLPKMKLRTEVFKRLTAAGKSEEAQAFTKLFVSDDSINNLLEDFGFSVQGLKVAPVA